MSGLLIKREPQPLTVGYRLLPVHPCMFAIVDREDYEKLSRYHWRLRLSNACFYAIRRKHIKSRTIEIKLHREIMQTQEGYECHHINRKTLDCRKANLQNLAPKDHAIEHGKNA